MKFLDPPTSKWQPCKSFAKLIGNHLLMANIFKFPNIKHLVYWKCIRANTNLPIIISVCEKVWFTVNGLSKILIFNFSFFIFPKLYDYCQKCYRKFFLFYNGFRGFWWSSTMSQTFLIYILLTMKRQWNEISIEMHFVSLFFLNEKSITTSLFWLRDK